MDFGQIALSTSESKPYTLTDVNRIDQFRIDSSNKPNISNISIPGISGITEKVFIQNAGDWNLTNDGLKNTITNAERWLVITDCKAGQHLVINTADGSTLSDERNVSGTNGDYTVTANGFVAFKLSRSGTITSIGLYNPEVTVNFSTSGGATNNRFNIINTSNGNASVTNGSSVHVGDVLKVTSDDYSDGKYLKEFLVNGVSRTSEIPAPSVAEWHKEISFNYTVTGNTTIQAVYVPCFTVDVQGLASGASAVWRANGFGEDLNGGSGMREGSTVKVSVAPPSNKVLDHWSLTLKNGSTVVNSNDNYGSKQNPLNLTMNYSQFGSSEGYNFILTPVFVDDVANSKVGVDAKNTSWTAGVGDGKTSNMYCLTKGNEYTFEFDCHQGAAKNEWNSWVVMACDGNIGNTKFILRPDSRVYDTDTDHNGNVTGSDECKMNPTLALKDAALNWEQFKADLDGAHVKVKVAYDGEKVFVYEVITNNGRTYTYYYPYDYVGSSIELYIGVDQTQLTNFNANYVKALKIVTSVENTSGQSHPEMGNVVITNDEGVSVLEGSIVGKGTNIHLTATANPGYLFERWSGGDTPQVSTRDFVVGSNSDPVQHTFHAYFDALSNYESTWTLYNSIIRNNWTFPYSNEGQQWITDGNWFKSDFKDGEIFSGVYADVSGSNEIEGFKGLLFSEGNVAVKRGEDSGIRLYGGQSGIVKIPVTKDEIVTINANTASGTKTLKVTNANNATTNLSLVKDVKDYVVIANADGYIELQTLSDNDLYINRISKSLIYDFTFADGDNVAATPGTTGYVNEIAGLPKYPLLEGATYVWTSSNPAEVQVNRNTGEITVNESFSGNVTITATRLKIGNYPAIAKTYTLSSTTNELHHDNETTHASVELNESGTAIFDVDAYWKDEDDPEIAGKDIKYTVISSTATNATATPDEEGFGTSEIAIEGKGTTIVMASCGAISCTFYIDTYGFVFDESSKVFNFAGTTFTRTVTGATSYSMEKIGAISTKGDCTINASTGEISGLPAYNDNLGGALVVKTTQAPTNVTATYIENPKFDENITGWTNDISNNAAANDGYQTAGKYTLLDNFIEAWHDVNDATLTDGQIYSTVSNVPAGKYILKVNAIAVNQSSGPATNVYLFAQEGNRVWQTVPVSTANGEPQEFTLNFTKIKGDTNLKIGIATRSGDGTVNANWIAADNFKLSQYKEASYVLTIPYKKYTWNFYNEDETADIKEAQVLTGNHLTMGDLTANGNPHAASEVEAKTSIAIPNTGDKYPGKYVIDAIYNSVAPADFKAANPSATKAQQDANNNNYNQKLAILKELTWQSIQNGAENDQTRNDAHMFWNYTFKTRQHRNRSASEPLEYFNEPLFSYKNAVNGNNVRIVKDTQGLIFDAGANAFGINDRFVASDVHASNGDLTETAVSVREQDRAILIYKGASFKVPFVKQGDYVKLHWYRHSDNAGDLFSVTNALDMDDVEINPDHLIRMTGSHYQGQKGTQGVYRGYTIVRAKQDGPITFTAKANSWMEIYTVELTNDYDTELRVICSDVIEDTDHPTDGWGGPMCSGTTGKNMDTDVIHVVRDARSTAVYDRSTLSVTEKIEKELKNDGACAALPSNQFGDNPLIYIASYPGATFGWNGWTLDVECAPVPEDASKLHINCQEPLVTRIGNNISYGVHALTNFKGNGTAHVIVRTKSGGVSGSPRYTLDKQEAYFPVGEYQPQEYPYTWDFRDYNISGTKDGSNGIRYNRKSAADTDSYGGWNSNQLATWTEVGPTVQAERNINTYNKFLFADGSQLTMNQSNNNGATYIREAEGLRFDLSGDWQRAHYWNNNASVTMDGNTLSVNGTITIPEVNRGMYVFVRSSKKPNSVTGAVYVNDNAEINSVEDNFSVDDFNTRATVNMKKDQLLANTYVYKVTGANIGQHARYELNQQWWGVKSPSNLTVVKEGSKTGDDLNVGYTKAIVEFAEGAPAGIQWCISVEGESDKTAPIEPGKKSHTLNFANTLGIDGIKNIKQFFIQNTSGTPTFTIKKFVLVDNNGVQSPVIANSDYEATTINLIWSDVVIDLPSDAQVEAIGVTDEFKMMTNGKGWATDSRVRRIDYNETETFTKSQMEAYVAVNAPTIFDNGEDGVINMPKRQVIPSKETTDANGWKRGLLIRDKANVDNENIFNGERRLIPLFVPACNIPDDNIAGNRMIDNIPEQEVSYDFSKLNYVFTGIYYPYDKNSNTHHHDNPIEGDYAFYILREKDIMRANSAYLQVEKPTNNAKGRQMYIILGEDEETGIHDIIYTDQDIHNAHTVIYTINGVKLNAMPKVSGVYIINGRKVFVKQ